MPTATFSNNTSSHRYEVQLDGELAGFLAYKMRDGGIELAHTETLPAFSGKGVGGMLAKGALEEARKTGLKVAPSCSFIAGYLKKHPDQLDVVSAEMQEKYDLDG